MKCRHIGCDSTPVKFFKHQCWPNHVNRIDYHYFKAYCEKHGSQKFRTEFYSEISFEEYIAAQVLES